MTRSKKRILIVAACGTPAFARRRLRRHRV